MYSIKSVCSIIVAFILGCTSLQAQAPQYNVTVIPLLPQMKYLYAARLNNLGEVVGVWKSKENQLFAFLYSNGITTDLGPLISNSESIAYDINDNGQIAGIVDPYTSESMAFLFSLANGVQYIGPQKEGISSAALGINNAGQSTGYYYSQESQHTYAAIFLQNGTIIPLDTYITPGYAYDINDAYGPNGLGQVVGATITDDGDSTNAFFYSNGERFNISSVCPQQPNSVATSINNANQVVGACGGGASIYFGFIYNITDASTDPLDGNAIPYSINDSGWIVGRAGPYYDEYPFLFINGTMYNLYDLIPSTLGIEFLQTWAINNQGQISANCNLGGILLTPIEAVP